MIRHSCVWFIPYESRFVYCCRSWLGFWIICPFRRLGIPQLGMRCRTCTVATPFCPFDVSLWNTLFYGNFIPWWTFAALSIECFLANSAENLGYFMGALLANYDCQTPRSFSNLTNTSAFRAVPENVVFYNFWFGLSSNNMVLFE